MPRRLLRPLLGSMLIHFLIMAALTPVLTPNGREASPARVLQVRLLTGPLPELPQAEPTLIQPATRLHPASRRPVSPRPLPEALPALRVESPAVTPAPSFARAQTQTGSAASDSGGTAALSDSNIAASVTGVPASSDTAPDAAGLRQYRLDLAGEARKFKRFPESARRAGWYGTVEVRIEVGAHARLAALAKSSGYPALDHAALEMLRQAAARTELPEILRGRQFRVLLPVVFEAEE